MDNKRFFLLTVVSLVVMVGWFLTARHVQQAYPQAAPQARTENVATTLPTTQLATAPQPPAATVPSIGPAPTPATAPASNSGLTVVQPESAVNAVTSVTLGSTEKSDDFHLGLKLTSTGAGIDAAILNEFKQVVDRKDPYTFQTPAPGKEDASRVLSTQSITVDGRSIDLKSAAWTLAQTDATSATFTLDILRDGKPVLRATKHYRLERARAADGKESPSGGYEVTVETTFANLTGSALQTTAVLIGPSVPPYEIERGGERNVVHAYAAASNRQVYLRRMLVDSFGADKPEVDITRDDSSSETGPLAWLGGSGAYFNALMELQSPGQVTAASALVLNPEQKDGHYRDAVTALRTAPLTLAPGQAATQSYKLFFGPKRRAVLEQPFYSAYPRAYDETLVATSWICGFCTWNWMIRLLVGLLNVFHMFVRDWGVAIILLVCIVRTLLHPITRRSQESMKKMQKLQPQLEALKKRYADDKDGLAKAQMEFMRESGPNQLAGCLPMFLQTPIWLALYAGLQSTFELRHQPFLYNLTWIHDLAKPDGLISFAPVTLPLIGMVTGINLIPFLMAIVFFLQYKLTPKPPPATEEQAQQQKMMQWMTLIMPVFLYPAPSGLNIYILTSTTFGIIESKLIRDAFDRKEQLIAEGKIVVPKRDPKKGGGLMQKLLQMQERADELKRGNPDAKPPSLGDVLKSMRNRKN